MPTNHTPNYNLSQWQKADKVLMEDFNADNSKIDAALKAQASALAAKADSSKIDTTLKSHADALAGKAEISALAALAEQVGTRNCRAYLTSYGGDGASSHTITFPSKPWLIITLLNGIGTISIRGCRTGTIIGDDSATSHSQLKVTWSENSVILSQANGYVNPYSGYVTLLALIEA